MNIHPATKIRLPLAVDCHETNPQRFQVVHQFTTKRGRLQTRQTPVAVKENQVGRALALRHHQFIVLAGADRQLVEERDVVLLEIEMGAVLREQIIERIAGEKMRIFRPPESLFFSNAFVVVALTTVWIRQQLVSLLDFDESLSGVRVFAFIWMPALKSRISTALESKFVHFTYHILAS